MLLQLLHIYKNSFQMDLSDLNLEDWYISGANPQQGITELNNELYLVSK